MELGRLVYGILSSQHGNQILSLVALVAQLADKRLRHVYQVSDLERLDSHDLLSERRLKPLALKLLLVWSNINAGWDLSKLSSLANGAEVLLSDSEAIIREQLGSPRMNDEVSRI